MIRKFLYREIRLPLALLFVSIFGVLAAWFTISMGEKILDESRESPAFDWKKRNGKIEANNGLEVEKI